MKHAPGEWLPYWNASPPFLKTHWSQPESPQSADFIFIMTLFSKKWILSYYLIIREWFNNTKGVFFTILQRSQSIVSLFKLRQLKWKKNRYLTMCQWSIIFQPIPPVLLLIYCGFTGRCRLQYGAQSPCMPQF